jgi:nucleoside-diphosphate-sugar epimerase
MLVLLGSRGFVGQSVLAELEQFDECIGIDVHNYDEYCGTRCDVLVNVNGNSKKFLAAEDPKAEFDMSVRSVVRSVYDFPCQRYVFISTVDVYTDFAEPANTGEDTAIDTQRQSPYGFHKWLAEQYVRKTCASWLITRLGGMVGPGLKKGPVYDLMHDVPLRVHVDSRYQYIHTRTVGAVVRTLLERDVSGEVFNVCGTGTVSLREVAGLLGKDVVTDDTLEKQHYEISNARLAKLLDVPTTQASVERFLQEEELL